jgi:hypothetical protein
MVIHIRIKKLNIAKQINRDAAMGLVGPRRTGKTFLSEALCYEMKFKRAAALYGSEGSREAFQKFIYDTYLHDATIELLQSIVEKQKENYKKLKSQGCDRSASEMLLIVDDKGFDDKFMKHKIVKEIGANARNFNMASMWLIQYIIMMSTGSRGNFDWMFFTRDVNIENRKKAYKMYGALCQHEHIWQAIFNAATQQRCVLAIDVTNSTTNNLEDSFFWYRAPHLPDWKMGDKEFRDYHIARVEQAIRGNHSVRIPEYNFSFAACDVKAESKLSQDPIIRRVLSRQLMETTLPTSSTLPTKSVSKKPSTTATTAPTTKSKTLSKPKTRETRTEESDVKKKKSIAKAKPDMKEKPTRMKTKPTRTTTTTTTKKKKTVKLSSTDVKEETKPKIKKHTRKKIPKSVPVSSTTTTTKKTKKKDTHGLKGVLV